MPDTRTIGAPLSLNGRLFNRFIRHDHHVERAKAGIARDVSRYLRDAVFSDLGERLELRIGRIRRRRDVARIHQTATWGSLRDLLRSSLTDGYRTARLDLASQLRELAIEESRFVVRVFGEEFAFDYSAKVPALREFRRAVTRQPINGHTLGEWFTGLRRTTETNTLGEINIGLQNGESTDQIIRRVLGRRGVFDRALKQTETIVETAAGHAAGNGRALAVGANGAVVAWEVWSAILDDATCPACASLDGSRFRVGEGPVPPDATHPGCRCKRIPAIKSAKELGLKEGDLPEIERRAMDGKVPQKTTYAKWLKTQPKAVQDEVLGPTRGRLYRQGKVSLNQMVDARLRPITLNELARKEGIEIPRVRRPRARIPTAEVRQPVSRVSRADLRKKPPRKLFAKIPRTGREIRLRESQQVAQQNAQWLRGNEGARKVATFSERRDWMNWEWVHGSRRRSSVLMKRAAIEEFRLNGVAFAGKKRYSIRASEVTFARRDLRRMRNETAAYFKKRGIKTIKLYRGLKSRVEKPGALTSWTTDRNLALRFDGHTVLEMEVPVDRILTGHKIPGWTTGIFGDQSEWIVMR